MISSPKKLKEYFSDTENRRKLIFGVYLYMTACISIFVGLVHNNIPYENYWIIAGWILAIPIVMILTKYLFKFTEKLEICKSKHKETKYKLLFFIVSFLLATAAFLIMFYIYYPGCYWYDSYYQLLGAIDHARSDWHPYLQTFLAFELPYVLTGYAEAIPVIQAVFFALAIAYMIESIYEISNKWIAIISYLFIMLNPNTIYMSITLLKDTSLCIVYIISLTTIARLWLRNYSKITTVLSCILLAINLCLITCFRHNGFLITIILYIVCFLFMNKKTFTIVLSLSLSLILVVQFPLSKYLEVGKYNNVRLELYSIPQIVFKNVFNSHPELIDEDIKEDFFNFYDGDYSNTTYSTDWTQFGTVMTKYKTNYYLLFKLYADTARLVLACPKHALNAIFGFNFFVFNFAPSSYSAEVINFSFITEFKDSLYESGIFSSDYKGSDLLQHWVSQVAYWANAPFGQIALYLLLLVFLIIRKCKFSNKSGWIKFLLVFGILIYSITTGACLHIKEFRYFYFIELAFPLLVVLLCYKDSSIKLIKKDV